MFSGGIEVKQVEKRLSKFQGFDQLLGPPEITYV